jgi:hypothetical protein
MFQNPLIGFYVGLAWVTLVAIVSVFYHRAKGKPIFCPSFPNATYKERWISGESKKNLLTLLGGARNCLWVAVTDRELRVGLMFPFNLLFLGEVYDLEHCIKGSSITDVAEGSFFSAVSITFEREGGQKTILVIRPRDRQRLLVALEQIRMPELAAPNRKV